MITVVLYFYFLLLLVLIKMLIDWLIDDIPRCERWRSVHCDRSTSTVHLQFPQSPVAPRLDQCPQRGTTETRTHCVPESNTTSLEPLRGLTSQTHHTGKCRNNTAADIKCPITNTAWVGHRGAFCHLLHVYNQLITLQAHWPLLRWQFTLNFVETVHRDVWGQKLTSTSLGVNIQSSLPLFSTVFTVPYFPQFLPCDAMRCTVFGIVILSVRLSVCLPVTLVHCTVSTWFDLWSRFLHRMVAPSF